MDEISVIQSRLKELGYYKGNIDGIAGKLTRSAVEDFQRAKGLEIDGIVGPKTRTALGITNPVGTSSIGPVKATLTAAALKRMWPNGRADWIAGIAASAGTVLPLYGITTPLRLAHFMAQISHECGGGRVAVENLNYSKASRIAAVWPSRFTVASAAPYVMNARALANKVYNGRMGNRVGTSDGYDFRGQGLIQITGRDGFQQVGRIAELDLINKPYLATEPDTMLAVAAAFWAWKSLNQVVDGSRTVKGYPKGSLEAVTQVVNGGQNGIADRRAWLNKWKRELGA